METKTLYATGAYGRAAKLEDWVAGKDFRVIEGAYFSIRDVEFLRKRGWTHVEFRGVAGNFTVDLANPREAAKAFEIKELPQ